MVDFFFSTVYLSDTDNSSSDMEIDPTLNEDLHVYIWNKLLKKIEIESAK
jgi:hypothetical protein